MNVVNRLIPMIKTVRGLMKKHSSIEGEKCSSDSIVEDEELMVNIREDEIPQLRTLGFSSSFLDETGE